MIVAAFIMLYLPFVSVSKAIAKEHSGEDSEWTVLCYFAGMDTQSYRNSDFSDDTHWDEFITERAFTGQNLNRKN
jgi:hypothetical protein